jgi:hypothetical protein
MKSRGEKAGSLLVVQCIKDYAARHSARLTNHRTSSRCIILLELSRSAETPRYLEFKSLSSVGNPRIEWLKVCSVKKQTQKKSN